MPSSRRCHPRRDCGQAGACRQPAPVQEELLVLVEQFTACTGCFDSVSERFWRVSFVRESIPMDARRTCTPRPRFRKACSTEMAVLSVMIVETNSFFRSGCVHMNLLPVGRDSFVREQVHRLPKPGVLDPRAHRGEYDIPASRSLGVRHDGQRVAAEVADRGEIVDRAVRVHRERWNDVPLRIAVPERGDVRAVQCVKQGAGNDESSLRVCGRNGKHLLGVEASGECPIASRVGMLTHAL